MFWVFCTGFFVGLAVGMFLVGLGVVKQLRSGLILVMRDGRVRWIESG